MAEYTKPVPVPETEALTAPFWEATKRHELVLPRCRKCNEYFWYARPACPRCLEEDWEWSPVSGKGRLHAFTIVRQAGNPAFNDDIPYTYAMVQLDEGPRMISNLVEVEVPDGVAVDMRLEATYHDITDDWTLVKFKPI